MLDEVIFAVRTDDKDDLAWLDEVVPTVPEYRKWEGAKGRGGNYQDAWNVVEKGTMYIKIDDDVVRIPTACHLGHRPPFSFLDRAAMLTPLLPPFHLANRPSDA